MGLYNKFNLSTSELKMKLSAKWGRNLWYLVKLSLWNWKSVFACVCNTVDTQNNARFWRYRPFTFFRLPPACSLVCWTFLRPWRWRRYVPPERRLLHNGLHGVISQKTTIFITTAVKTLNPTYFTICLSPESVPNQTLSLFSGHLQLKFLCHKLFNFHLFSY
jgi:hypothetical protein